MRDGIAALAEQPGAAAHPSRCDQYEPFLTADRRPRHAPDRGIPSPYRHRRFRTPPARREHSLWL
ncbi:hypothetical protein KPL78_07845 [Roseomonas sp. HJA6]|uniref:Uncharacterized protein n=1 Tax=Roseomonas alba TaxID=2846776 RepID=A0ABS7A639_9PROT|nr:hypothetical protein [Neoroseomonas alba]